MMTATPSINSVGREALEQRLRRVLPIHFDPKFGASFWLDRAARLGIDPMRDIRSLADLTLLGEMTAGDLQDRPLIDYIPRRFHDQLDRFIVGQTGGATGRGTWTAYREDEFFDAFVEPFMDAAAHVGFPRREQWLFIGPSGPHIIGKVVGHLAESLHSLDAFSVDFDPRWARSLAEGSFARRRYLQHVLEQAMAVIDSQSIGVLFATPPVLGPLAELMTQIQRRRIKGVHYGGVALDLAELDRFQNRAFPEAVHLAGYGNTLLGCCLELSAAPDRTLDYFPHGDRLWLETVPIAYSTNAADTGAGRLRCTRLDESMLIVRLLERDEATLIDPPPDAPPTFQLPGVRNPHPLVSTAQVQGGTGLY